MAYTHSLGILACLLITALIVALGPYSSADMFLPDQGNFWYYWKLAEPTFWTHFSAWTLYGLHQLSIWGLIAWAQRQRHRYTRTLHPVNLAALGCNLLFVCLHIVQTRLFYDGLAQDTPVVSSQLSVVFMLVFILIMENTRRGIFFGRKVAFLDRPGGFLRRYHGYYFSWAIIYTFWFHPIEDNLGHLLGIFYTLLLLLQGSLFFTSYHRNRYWTVLLEVFVVIHGAMIAYLTQAGGHWMMFLFGFLGLFVITQMHGIGLTYRARWGVVVLYTLAVLVGYSDRITQALEVFKIPLIEYGLAFLCAAVLWTMLLAIGRLPGRRT
jgi:hypothetical protein